MLGLEDDLPGPPLGVLLLAAQALTVVLAGGVAVALSLGCGERVGGEDGGWWGLGRLPRLGGVLGAGGPGQAA